MLRDTLERLFWTFVAAFLGTLVGTAVLDLGVSSLQAAAVAGLGAVANAVLLLARWRLSVLPNPGEGLTKRHYPEDDPERWGGDDGQAHGDLALPPPEV